MNKYQEALNYLKKIDHLDVLQFVNAIDTLQEALDELEVYKEREAYEYEQWQDRN